MIRPPAPLNTSVLMCPRGGCFFIGVNFMDVKEFATFQQQLEKLKQRGCIVADENFAIRQLKRINYYRFTAYFLPFKKDNDTYIDGTSFDTVFRIYEFDRKLRGLLLSICEQIELMLRTRIAYYHSEKYGALGYLNTENFNNRHNHDKFIEKCEKEIKQNENKPFVQHHIEKYDSKFPLWVIIELFSMGDLSFFFSDMRTADKKSIARNVFNTTHYNVSSWLFCLTILRNHCAHYARLYNARFGTVPVTPNKLNYQLKDSIFDYIMALKFLYPDVIEWQNVCLVNLYALIEEYQGVIDMKRIGFPENWKELLVQQNPSLK